MSAFSKVVVGLDGSRPSLQALRWAADRISDHELHVVGAGAPDPVVPDNIRVASIHSRDLPPSQALIAVATDIDADAIVIGPHGSGLGRGLGSVARRLLTASPIPVIVVDGLEPPRSLALRPPVVACVGYGEPATAAAGWAAHYASEQGLPLVLLHAVAYQPIFPLDSGSDLLASYLGTGVSIEWANDELQTLSDKVRSQHPDLEISTHVKASSVIKAVSAAGETAEIIVLGKRSDEQFLHIVGTPRLRRLVARSNFPTAVVPPQHAR